MTQGAGAQTDAARTSGLTQQSGGGGQQTVTEGSGSGLTQQTSFIPSYNVEVEATKGHRDDGKNAAAKQKSAMMAALASAAITAAIAAATCPNPKMQAMCTAATLGTMAGLAIAGAMNGAKNKSDAQVANVTAGAKAVDAAPISANKSYQATARSLGESSKRAGNTVDLDKSTVKLADGRKIAVDNLSSPSAMAAAGLKPGEIKALGDLLKDANSKAKVEAKMADSSDGQAGDEAYSGGSRTVYSDSPSGSGGGEIAGRKPADISGATRNFHGTKIGVAAESIFVMMNRRYHHEANQKKPGFL
jgi:hypothetical protein